MIQYGTPGKGTTHFLSEKKKDAVDFIILLIIAFTIILMSCLLLEYIM